MSLVNRMIQMSCLTLLSLGCFAYEADSADSKQAKSSTSVAESTGADCEQFQRYVFSWPLVDGCNMRPRGGTSTGTPVTLAAEPHADWQNLQKAGLSKFERDRRAILAMAGPYKTSFEFLETVGYTPDFEPARPYQSWGTEYVYVLEDSERFISLQHIMVMYFEHEGEVQGPMVMKHWRQDWQYEKRENLRYQGNNEWSLEKLPKKAVAGTWSQAVFQVDDSPRYESFGQWDHRGNLSVWRSELTWRPLPRREHSVRDDYDLLEGWNQHSIVPSGWVHEQENFKRRLVDKAKQKPLPLYLAKEQGVNRYQRITDFDFSAGDKYLKATEPFWQQVRRHWRDIIASKKGFRLRETHEGQPLFVPLFDFAQQLHDGKEYSDAEIESFVQTTLSDYVH